jgi:arginyl-tRNA synthetase
MKSIVAQLLETALAKLPELAALSTEFAIESTIERTRDASHGDLASNLAMRLAKPARKSPRDIAASIIDQLGDSDQIDKVEIAGPGFINFYLSGAVFSTLERRMAVSRRRARREYCSNSYQQTRPDPCTSGTAGMPPTAPPSAICCRQPVIP